MRIPFYDLQHGSIELEVSDDDVRQFLGRLVNTHTWRFEPEIAHDAMNRFRKRLIEGGERILPVVEPVEVQP